MYLNDQERALFQAVFRLALLREQGAQNCSRVWQ